MRGLFNKHFWKFLVGFLAIMAAGFFLLVWANIYHNGKNSEQSKAEQYLKDLKKAYDNDTYGGKTPEETLQLFIDALKKGDIDLASKYFVVEKQQEWRKNLETVKQKKQLDIMVSDLNRPKEKKSLGSEENFVFYVYNDANQLALSINIAKVPNGIWKIQDL